MKNILFYLKTVLLTSILCTSIVYAQKDANPVPYLAPKGTATQLWVDNKPFLMIAGELHNSSSSTCNYMKPIWSKLKESHLNTVLIAVSWQQTEPDEGKFDFTLLDSWIENAETHHLKLVLLWFGTWKNGESSYTPDWVKKDDKRFFRVKNKEGKNIETISPFCEEAMKADGRAFRQLMKHLAETDKYHTVIMVQLENEMGVFQEIDFSPEALNAFNGEVPKPLVRFLKSNESRLQPEIRKAWGEKGRKMKGNWIQVFGDTPYAKEFFMASRYASYVNYVAGQGKQVHPLPTFVNAWIIQTPEQLPGQYPNGGPVSRVLDVYKALAGSIDILSPDIYLPDFKKEVAKYKREDNPLLVPESNDEPGRAFYAFSECDALCFAIFGIEDYMNSPLLKKVNRTLNELEPLILHYQGTGKMRGFLRYKEQEQQITLGDYTFQIAYNKKEEPAFGMIIQTGKEQFVISGMNFTLRISSVKKNKMAYFLQIWEGEFENEKWISSRLLNGDETLHNSLFMAPGKRVGEELTPATYRITVYTRD